MSMKIATRIRRVSELHGSFVLRSGKTSDVYFDKYQFESDPVLLREIGRLMLPLIPTGTEVIAGLEMGGIPLATVLSQATGLPTAFIRKTPKEYGTCRYAEGAQLMGKRFVLVEDVVSSGGAILDAAAMLRSDGCEPSLAVCVIDRELGGKQALARAGIELRALLTQSDISAA